MNMAHCGRHAAGVNQDADGQETPGEDRPEDHGASSRIIHQKSAPIVFQRVE
jgi:hypothetical protein